MNLSVEEAARIGMELRRVCQTDSFHRVVETLKEQYRYQVFDSDPEDIDARERAYSQARALDELLITFNTFIAIAEAEALEADEDQFSIFE